MLVSFRLHCPSRSVQGSKAFDGLGAVSGTGLGTDLVCLATPHPFEEFEKSCHACCKTAKGDLTVQATALSQSLFMLAIRLLDEFASIEGKLQFPPL